MVFSPKLVVLRAQMCKDQSYYSHTSRSLSLHKMNNFGSLLKEEKTQSLVLNQGVEEEIFASASREAEILNA